MRLIPPHDLAVKLKVLTCIGFDTTYSYLRVTVEKISGDMGRKKKTLKSQTERYVCMYMSDVLPKTRTTLICCVE